MDSAWVTCARSTTGRSKRSTNSTIPCCGQQAMALLTIMGEPNPTLVAVTTLFQKFFTSVWSMSDQRKRQPYSPPM